MKRNRVRFIYWAFVLSVFVHVSLAPLAPHLRVEAADKEPSTITLDSPHPRATLPPTPPPTPKPRVKPQTQQTKPSTVAINKPVLPTQPKSGNVHVPPGDKPALPPDDGGGNTGTDTTGTAGPPATQAPTPSPKPVCSAPFADAQTISKYTPEMPQIARDQGLTGTAQIKVDLSASGTVTDAKIFQSSGNTALDTVAIESARRTTYAPKVVNCERVPGSYLFRVEFSDN